MSNDRYEENLEGDELSEDGGVPVDQELSEDGGVPVDEEHSEEEELSEDEGNSEDEELSEDEDVSEDEEASEEEELSEEARRKLDFAMYARERIMTDESVAKAFYEENTEGGDENEDETESEGEAGNEHEAEPQSIDAAPFEEPHTDSNPDSDAQPDHDDEASEVGGEDDSDDAGANCPLCLSGSFPCDNGFGHEQYVVFGAACECCGRTLFNDQMGQDDEYLVD